jgi:cytidylate kinase
MPVITINGPIGCGSVTVGQMVAQELNLNFVDRLIFTQAARLMGTPVKALIEKEQRVVRFKDRLSRFIQTVLERSAVAGVSGDPYFGPGIGSLPVETLADLAGESSLNAPKVDDKAFLEATTKVVNDLHEAGNVVIIGRGANVILADTPGVMHVGLVAPLEQRVETMMQREHLDRDEARDYVQELDEAWQIYFRKFFNASPTEASRYHMILNMDKIQASTAAEVIVHACGDLAS